MRFEAVKSFLRASCFGCHCDAVGGLR